MAVCKLSIIVAAYKMRREIPRTLATLAASYQMRVNADDYEVIVVENGSGQLSDSDVGQHGTNFRLAHVTEPTLSPAPALNLGYRLSNGQIIASMIDGARMLSPGVVAGTIKAFEFLERAAVVIPAWHLGPDVQNESIKYGYNQAVEDRLLSQVDWKNDGYELFKLCERMDPSCAGAAWMGKMAEANYIAVPRDAHEELGGFDERFISPGGGAVNLDFFNRVCERENMPVITLLGEGSFHQFHGGTTTNVATDNHPWQQIAAEYAAITKRAYAPADYDPIFVGQLSDQARSLLARSPNIFSFDPYARKRYVGLYERLAFRLLAKSIQISSRKKLRSR